MIKIQCTEEVAVERDRRTVRITGFPKNTTDSQIENLLSSIPEGRSAFLFQQIVECIQIKRDVFTHLFSGIVHVVCKSAQDAFAFTKRTFENNLRTQIL